MLWCAEIGLAACAAMLAYVIRCAMREPVQNELARYICVLFFVIFFMLNVVGVIGVAGVLGAG